MTETYIYQPVPDNLPWPDRVCCASMLRYRTLNSECEQHGYNCPDRPISWFNEKYHIRSPNGEYQIRFCPWCGGHLNNEVKYPKKITRTDFNNLLCHDCARPLHEVMCPTCCECKFCTPNWCGGKIRWMIEEAPGSYAIYGNTSMFAPRHVKLEKLSTEPEDHAEGVPAEAAGFFTKMWQKFFGS